MASVAWVDVMIMMILVDCAQLNQELEPLFGTQGGEVSFPFMSSFRHPSNFFATLYRSTEEGNLFLMNTSDPSQRSDSEQAERLVHHKGKNFILFQNLSLSDSGDYMTERWGKAVLKEKRIYRLTVCKDKCNDRVEYSGGGSVSVKNVSLGIILQVYKTPHEGYFHGPIRTTLVLDTTQSMKVLPGEQSTTINVLRDDTTVFLYFASSQRASYSILIRNLSQCCIFKVDFFQPGVCSTNSEHSDYFLKPGQRLSLPCSGVTNSIDEIIWKTPVKELSLDVSASLNVSHEEEEDMYIERSSYSLVIPSVETKHTGIYECKPDYFMIMPSKGQVFVCFDLEATNVLFSVGGTAKLVCGTEHNVSRAKGTFYGHLDQEQEQLSLKPEDMKVIHEEQMKRKRTRRNQFSLTMTNLTLNDSGLYLCRIWGYSKEWTPFCHDRKIYLLHKHPFGIDSTFYRVYSSLMACGLLGMICAVISVHLRVRGRDQTSKQRLRRTAEPSARPTREGEQFRVEPDQDDEITA